MAKTKFKDFAAIMRNSDDTSVVIARWKNIQFLRHRRRTSSSYKKSRIKRIPVDAGIEFILSAFSENSPLENYPNLGFYKFFHDEQERLKTYFTSIQNDSNTYALSLTDMQRHLPEWFVNFIAKTINRALYDTDLWNSWRNFHGQFYYITLNVFAEHPEVKKLFYARFEASLAGTLEKDVIAYTRPKPSYEKSDDWDTYENENKMRYKNTLNMDYYSNIVSMPEFRDNNVLRDYITSIAGNSNLDGLYSDAMMESVPQSTPVEESTPMPVEESTPMAWTQPVLRARNTVSW